MRQLDYIALGNGKYRVTGPALLAEVWLVGTGNTDRTFVVVESNNPTMSDDDIALWCEKNIN